MSAEATANWSPKEDIKAYWSLRAATFDDQFGHRILPGPEHDAWAAVLREHLGGENLRVLELASGTGEVSKVLLALGHNVTGIDFSEAMVERSRRKHAGHPRARFFLGDAERTLEPDATYDAVVCRHLVWTLTDPQAALCDWARVLKPGGRVVIFDGDFVNQPWRGKIARRLMDAMAVWTGPDRHRDPSHNERHARIMAELPFSLGLRFSDLAAMAEEVGFVDIRRHGFGHIAAAQRRVAPGVQDWLRTFLHTRFVFTARRL